MQKVKAIGAFLHMVCKVQNWQGICRKHRLIQGLKKLPGSHSPAAANQV